MSLQIKRSFVPRIAVQRTIQRGIEFHEKFHGPVTPEVRRKIEQFVIRQANILNQRSMIRDDEAEDSSSILYDGRRKPQ